MNPFGQPMPPGKLRTPHEWAVCANVYRRAAHGKGYGAWRYRQAARQKLGYGRELDELMRTGGKPWDVCQEARALADLWREVIACQFRHGGAIDDFLLRFIASREERNRERVLRYRQELADWLC